MRDFFRNTSLFSVLFFSILFTDIWIKLYSEVSVYRFITKGGIIMSLLAYYLINNKERVALKRTFVIGALLCFWVGDIFLLLDKYPFCFSIGGFCFILGKMFYVFRFSNKKDFSLLKILPFLIVFFFYMVGILALIYKNLENTFYLALLYFFIALTTIIFAYLRKGEVNTLSYYWVLIGMMFSVLSDSITALKTFYDKNIAYHLITIMLFYGLSQYFIVSGIVKETNLSTIKGTP